MNILQITDLGRMAYADALARQREAHAEVLAARAARGKMQLLLVEHDPQVITVSRRPTAGRNILASDERLAALGVQRVETDRGGDVTWHGPGQLVAYPILDLERMGLRIHGYMRFLEEIVIGVLSDFGVPARRDPEATGVWTGAEDRPGLKICAMGVRVSRWVSMHGLALNVDPDLRAFDLIVPCGLAGRGVTSMRQELGKKCPSMDEVKAALSQRISAGVARHVAALTDPSGPAPS
ncbi:MAG: lipoyl(octanoyl) transferase LipB [Planctomycetes bacterium]|nr:lipoyl(octanoyl) transferase LipB [Planctomycetota bacterium]